MTAYESGAGAHSSTAGTLPIPFLVLSALLCGVGLLGLAYWLVTFDWLYFASLIPLIFGALMLFTRGTGPDRA